MHNVTAKLLLVEDEKLTCEGLKKCIPWQNIGISELEIAADGLIGLKKAISFKPDIVLTDVHMPKMDGISMAFEIQKIIPDCFFIFLSGFSDKEYLKSAISIGAIDYIEKPIEIDNVVFSLKKAMKKHKIKEDRLCYGTEIINQEATLQSDFRTTSAELVLQATRLIETNFRNPNFSLDMLCENLGVSKTHLCAVYKKISGDTIAKEIKEKRILWAKNYLESFPYVKIKNVATESGFYDSNYFIKVFKRNVGKTPAEYIKEYIP